MTEHDIDSPASRTLAGRGVRIGVIDSGWDRSLGNPRVATGVGFVSASNDFEFAPSEDDGDRIGHGTICTNLILHVAPEAAVVPIRVFGTRLETSPHILIAGIEWAMAQGLRLLNLSLGTSRRDVMKPLYQACERARQQGVVIVAATDGTSSSGRTYPAVFEPVIGVGHAALADPYEVRFTPEGEVECGVFARRRSARGLGGREVFVSGTSYAAPVVCGRIACMMEREPWLNVDTVRERFAAAQRA